MEIIVALRDAEAGAAWFFDDDRRIEYEYEYDHSEGPCCGEEDSYWYVNQFSCDCFFFSLWVCRG